ncbi:hypothetical protein CCP3SC15_380025 [Gammaproteobacteria bacterium]
MPQEKPYEVRPNSKVRELSVRDIAIMMRDNPLAREAVARIDRFEGTHRMAEQVVHNERKNWLKVQNNKYRIDAAVQKHSGIFG